VGYGVGVSAKLLQIGTPEMSLTDLKIRKAKPADRPYKLFDFNGLYIHVQPNGSKLWRWKYRHSKKERLLSFGPYPLVSLAEAREKQAQGRKLLLDGKDPSVQRKLERFSSIPNRQGFPNH
jgi:hypothetical protein